MLIFFYRMEPKRVEKTFNALKRGKLLVQPNSNAPFRAWFFHRSSLTDVQIFYSYHCLNFVFIKAVRFSEHFNGRKTRCNGQQGEQVQASQALYLVRAVHSVYFYISEYEEIVKTAFWWRADSCTLNYFPFFWAQWGKVEFGKSNEFLIVRRRHFCS